MGEVGDALKDFFEIPDKDAVKSGSEKPEIVGECTACNGRVVKEEKIEHDLSTGFRVIGPGSQCQEKIAIYYYCKDCGLMYKFPPKQEK